MVHCCVDDCNNESKNKEKLQKRLQYFPVRGIWKPKIPRKKPYPKNPHLCSDHFTEQDFKRDLEHELLHLPPRKRLQEDAVPSIFPNRTEKTVKRRTHSEQRIAKRDHDDLIKQILAGSSPRDNQHITTDCTVPAECLTHGETTACSQIHPPFSQSKRKRKPSQNVASGSIYPKCILLPECVYKENTIPPFHGQEVNAKHSVLKDTTQTFNWQDPPCSQPLKKRKVSHTVTSASTYPSKKVQTECTTQEEISPRCSSPLSQGYPSLMSENLYFSKDYVCQVEEILDKSGLPQADNTNDSFIEQSSPEFIYKVREDHTYATAQPISSINENTQIQNTKSPIFGQNNALSQSSVQADSMSSEITGDNLTFNDDPTKDPDFNSQDSRYKSSDTASTASAEQNIPLWRKVVTQKKILVFESSLQKLFQRCQQCGSIVSSTNPRFKGSQMIVDVECVNHCGYTWRSSPVINKMAASNLLLPASVLFTGGTYSTVGNMATQLNMPIVNKRQFSYLQKSVLFPVVWNQWRIEEERVTNLLKEQETVILAGDARCDSPGYSAKFGTYSLMDSIWDLIAGFTVIQVTDVSSSQAMEKEGCDQTVGRKKADGIKINKLVTDRHTGVAKLMREKYKSISHQYDLWHFIKSIGKKLSAAAKRKGCQDLFMWISSILNHIWWAASACGGDAKLLKEMYLSIQYHIVNRHEWAPVSPDDTFTACRHAVLERQEERKTKWLTEGSPAHEALKTVLQNKRFLKDLPGVKDFCHTGQLEVFHSLLLKYCPKRKHFSAAGMNIRQALAALDHNSNVGRTQAYTKAGNPMGNVVFTKAKKHWVYKKIRQKKSYAFVDQLMEGAVKRQISGKKSPIKLPKRPQNIAPSDKIKPEKEELRKAHMAKFKDKDEDDHHSSLDEASEDEG